MDSACHTTQIQHCYVTSSQEVFREIHADIEYLPTCAAVIEAPAIRIEAHSDMLDLALTLRIPKTFLRACHPLKESGIRLDDATLVDWNQELANRLLGRMKARIITPDGELRLGLPAIDEHRQPGDEERHSALYFALAGEPMSCALQITLKHAHADLHISHECANTEESGELELF